MNVLISMLSWVWIVLATLAGKFMTNSVIYGSFLQLDAFFIRWWDLIRNFANFLLVVVLLYKIIEWMIKSDTTALKKVISKVLVAGVLVQASWFIIAATLDISNIVTSTLGTLPGQIISTTPEVAGDFSQNSHIFFQKHIQFNINTKKGTKAEPIEIENMGEAEQAKVTDMLLPTYKSLSGPLLFLGISVLKIQDYTYNEHEGYDFSDLLIDVGIDGLVLLIFSVSLLLLFVFNFLRVFVLWIIIPFSPLLIVLKVLDIAKLKNSQSIWAFLDPWRIVKLIFMPAIFVTYLSVILLFIVSIKSLFKSKGEFHAPESNIHITERHVGAVQGNNTYNTEIVSDGIFHFSMEGVKNTMADLFLYFFTLFFLWKLVLMTFKTDTWFKVIDQTMWTLTDTAKKITGSIWIIPVPGKGTIGMNQAWAAWDQVKSNGLASVNKVAQQQKETVNEMLWLDSPETVLQRQANAEDAKVFLNSWVYREVIQDHISRWWLRSISEVPYVMEYLHKRGMPDNITTKIGVEQWLDGEGKNHRIWNTNMTALEVIQQLWFTNPDNLEYWATTTSTSSWTSSGTPNNTTSSSPWTSNQTPNGT